ncbi:MAG: hypothetical protein QHC90_07390 [Shinella sp.]|nr:hypothetical protein [Shinella sp.]
MRINSVFPPAVETQRRHCDFRRSRNHIVPALAKLRFRSRPGNKRGHMAQCNVKIKENATERDLNHRAAA